MARASRMTPQIGAGGAVTIRLPGSDGRIEAVGARWRRSRSRRARRARYARREGERRRGFGPRTSANAENLETVRAATNRDGFGEPPTENDVVVRERRVRGGGGASALTRHRNLPATRFAARLAGLRARPRPSGPAAPHRAAASDRVRVRTRGCYGLRTAPYRSSSPPPRDWPTPRGSTRDPATSSR